MKKILLIILFCTLYAFSTYTAQCPSWSLNTTWQQWDCVSYDNVNYYAAGPSGIDYLPTQIVSLSVDANVNTDEPYDTWSGWVQCDSLPDSARIAICDNNFVYCADESSGYLKHDTIYTNDTINIKDTIYKYDTICVKVNKYDTICDTSIININRYDTNIVSVLDTELVNIFDTISYIDSISIPIYDTSYITINDTNIVLFLDTLSKTFDDTLELNLETTAISYITQYNIETSPYFIASLDSLNYDFSDSSIVTIEWSFHIFDNLGQYISKSEGTSYLYKDETFYNLKTELFKKNTLGQYIASNGKLLGTGVYIIKGSCIVYLDKEYQYRQFIDNSYGYKNK